MLNEPIIIWEKWIDPYELNTEDIEWPDHEELSDDEPITTFKKVNAISTRMGIIPYNEYTDCTKIFNFWIGHTNFGITQNIVEKLQKINGVETLDIFTRYRFRISFGKAFNEREVIDSINQFIKMEISA